MLVGETEEKDLQANFIDISEELINSGAKIINNKALLFPAGFDLG